MPSLAGQADFTLRQDYRDNRHQRQEAQGNSAVADELRRAGRLFGINCGHRPRGVSDGLFRKSSVEYDDEEDKALYHKVCKQRELERKVRKSKTEADMLEAAGDTGAQRKSAGRWRSRTRR